MLRFLFVRGLNASVEVEIVTVVLRYFCDRGRVENFLKGF